MQNWKGLKMRDAPFTKHENYALIFGYERNHCRKEMAETLNKTRRQLTRRLEKLKEAGVIN